MADHFTDHTDLTVSGGPVRLYRAGESGPPLLLLHGGMLDTAQGVWRNVVPHLVGDYRLHLIDLPRHGGSRPWNGRLDDAFFHRFLCDLLDQLGLHRVAIIGLSLGGGIAIRFALAQPDRVSALIAIGPGGIGGKRKAQFLTWLIMRTPGAMRLTSSYLARRPRAIRKSMIAGLTAGADTADFESIVALAHAEAVAKAEHGEPALDDWMTRSYGPFRMRTNFLPELPGLAVPTLWVRGANDRLVEYPELSAAAEATPGSRMTTIADAGHIVTYDRPDEFSRIAKRFLVDSLTESEAGPRPLPTRQLQSVAAGDEGDRPVLIRSQHRHAHS